MSDQPNNCVACGRPRVDPTTIPDECVDDHDAWTKWKKEHQDLCCADTDDDCAEERGDWKAVAVALRADNAQLLKQLDRAYRECDAGPIGQEDCGCVSCQRCGIGLRGVGMPCACGAPLTTVAEELKQERAMRLRAGRILGDYEEDIEELRARLRKPHGRWILLGRAHEHARRARAARDYAQRKLKNIEAVYVAAVNWVRAPNRRSLIDMVVAERELLSAVKKVEKA